MKMDIIALGAILFPLVWLFCCSSCGAEPDLENALWVSARRDMVRQLKAHGIKDERVLEVMGKVRRHKFIPESFRSASTAYGDHPCLIGHDQTISQPYIVAYMTERLELKNDDKVLEIGTGSGYQSAVLAECGADVYSIEIIPELSEHAATVLKSEGYEKVRVMTGDGYKGWPEHAPFDAIIVTCAPESMPQALKDQLAEGGRMIVPVGKCSQRLVIFEKQDGEIRKQNDLAVRFVPMVRGRGE